MRATMRISWAFQLSRLSVIFCRTAGGASPAGDNRKRQLQTEHIQARGWPLATIVSPTATVGIGAAIAAGTFIGHHCHVGPMARIGQSCILNTGCIVEHDCVVGDFTHVSVNATPPVEAS